MPQITAPRSGYNAQLSAYNVTESSIRRWRAQLAKAQVSASAAPARILCLGDSITEGTVGSTPFRSYNWPARLRTVLAADGRAGSVGEGCVVVGGQVPASYDERWTLGSGWSRVTGGLDGMWQAAPGSGTLSFPVPSCDTIKIWYVRHSINGTWTWNVDGGSSTGVASNGAISIQSTTFTVSAGAHTLNIIPHATTGYAMIIGIEYYTAAARNDVEVITGGGHSGYTSGQLATGSASPTTSFYTTDMMVALAPDLTAICLGRNDASGVGSSGYKASMSIIIDAARTTASKDVLLVAPPPASAGSYPYDSVIRTALYQLADEKDLPLLDLTLRFGSSWNAAPYNLSADNLHPNDAGSYAIGQAVANLYLNA